MWPKKSVNVCGHLCGFIYMYGIFCKMYIFRLTMPALRSTSAFLCQTCTVCEHTAHTSGWPLIHNANLPLAKFCTIFVYKHHSWHLFVSHNDFKWPCSHGPSLRTTTQKTRRLTLRGLKTSCCIYKRTSALWQTALASGDIFPSDTSFTKAASVLRQFPS